MKYIKYQIASDSAYEWVGWCKKELYKLNQLHKLGTITHHFYQFVNNIYAELIIGDVYDTIRLWGELAGVIFHPRSGTIQQIPYTEYTTLPSLGPIANIKMLPGVRGGWRDGKTLLNTEYLFPLDDADDASFTLSSEDVDESGLAIIKGDFSGTESLYGNLYWTNKETDANKLIVLSWRGTPTRHFRLPNNIDIPGFSNLETTVFNAIEDVPEYTSFGTFLYQNGLVLMQAPKYNWPRGGQDRCLILGAMQNTEGTIYIVTQSDHYIAPSSIELEGITHPIAKPGFYLALWKTGTQLDGWDLVSEQTYTRNGLPWFGNADGTVFVCSNGDSLTTEGLFVAKTNANGHYLESGAEGLISFHADFDDDVYHEYKNNDKVSSRVNVIFDSRSTAISVERTSILLSGIYSPVQEAPPSFAPFTISGPEDWTGDISDYYITSTPFGVDAPVNKHAPTGCGMQNVVFTSSCSDGSNMMNATFSVRMPDGGWELVSDITYGSISGTVITGTLISGDTKTVEKIVQQCGTDWGGIDNECKLSEGSCILTPYPTSIVCDPGFPQATTSFTPIITDCGSYEQTFTKCLGEPPPGSECGFPYQGTEEATIGPFVIPVCSYVTRRVICKWVCSPSEACTL